MQEYACITLRPARNVPAVTIESNTWLRLLLGDQTSSNQTDKDEDLTNNTHKQTFIGTYGQNIANGWNIKVATQIIEKKQ